MNSDPTHSQAELSNDRTPQSSRHVYNERVAAFISKTSDPPCPFEFGPSCQHPSLCMRLSHTRPRKQWPKNSMRRMCERNGSYLLCAIRLATTLYHLFRGALVSQVLLPTSLPGWAL